MEYSTCISDEEKKTVSENFLLVQPPEYDPKENAQIKKNKKLFFMSQVSNICSSFCWEKRLQQEERVEDAKTLKNG